MVAVLHGPDRSDDEEIERQVKTILPLYFHKFDEVTANQVLGKTVWSAAGYNRCGTLLANYDLTVRLKEIHAPTLIVVGRDDYVAPPSQAKIMHEHIPGSELVIFEHSSHLPYIEESDTFFATVHEMLRRTS